MTHALVLIDLQQEMERRIAAGVDYIGQDITANVTALLQTWRSQGWPILHVQHHASEVESPFHPDQPTARVMACASPEPNEPIFIKNTSSAFESTNIGEWLIQHHITDITVAGAVLGFCVSSIIRSAYDRGYNVQWVKDAVLAFGMSDYNVTAKQIFDVELAHLSDFAKVSDTKTVTRK